MKSVEKQYGDHFLQPTTLSALIKIQYFVKVKTEYDVLCLCCSPTPKAIIHINLAPGQSNINLPYAPPSDFQMVVGQPIIHDIVNHNPQQQQQQQPYNALPVLGQQGAGVFMPPLDTGFADLQQNYNQLPPPPEQHHQLEED